MSRNRFGLRRHIPIEVKREVQRRCGHGCIFCGSTIIHYEHFLPDFADARTHEPENIALVCPTHHDQITKGFIPKEVVAQQYQNPKALAQGYSQAEHLWFEGLPTVTIGGGVFTNIPIPIQIHGENLLTFEPSEDDGPTRISGILRTAIGGDMLEIVENEWRVKSGPWEFENVKSRYKFTYPGTNLGIILNLKPPHHIVIESFATISTKGVPIIATERELNIGGSRFQAFSATGGRIGMAIG